MISAAIAADFAQAAPSMSPGDVLTYVLGLGSAGGPIFWWYWTEEKKKHEKTRERLEAALSVSQEKRIEQGLESNKVISGMISQLDILQNTLQSAISLLQQVLIKFGGNNGGGGR